MVTVYNVEDKNDELRNIIRLPSRSIIKFSGGYPISKVILKQLERITYIDIWFLTY